MIVKKFNDKYDSINLLRATEALEIGDEFKTEYKQSLTSYLYEMILEQHRGLIKLSFEPKADLTSSVELLLEFYSDFSPIFQNDKGMDLEEYLEQLQN